jgi:hypothetical protein
MNATQIEVTFPCDPILQVSDDALSIKEVQWQKQTSER